MTHGKEKGMEISEINGIYYDYNESSIVKLRKDMYEDFCKCCEQENYSYKLLSKTTDYAICSANYRIIEFFISCMKAENEETVKTLCLSPKNLLIDRVNGITIGDNSDYWIDRVDIDIVKEALQRYDEPEFVEERTEIIKSLL